jgi:TRAP-type uncharacterized transport system substrate-binding protein
MTTGATARHPHKISATARRQLERMYDSTSGALRVSNRNTGGSIHNATAVQLVKLGFAKWAGMQRYGAETVRLTEAGVAKVQEWRTVAATAKR